jgi:hypothetical protein
VKLGRDKHLPGLFLPHHPPVFDLVRNGLYAGPLCGLQALNEPLAAPKLYIVTVNKSLRLGDGFGVVSANEWFVSDEMPVIADGEGAILWHHLGPCRPGDESHSSACAATSSWRSFFFKASRAGPGPVLASSASARRFSSAIRSAKECGLGILRMCGSPTSVGTGAAMGEILNPPCTAGNLNSKGTTAKIKRDH